MSVGDFNNLYEEIKNQIHEEADERISNEFLDRINKLSIKEQARIWLKIGNVYKGQEKLELAINSWQKVPESMEEEYGKAQFNLGVIYNAQNNLEQAIESWHKVPESMEEEYGKAQFNLGGGYKSQGQLELAIDSWHKVPESTAEPYARAQFNLGNIYYTQGQLELAIAVWQKIPESIEEEYSYSQWNLAQLYLENKEYEKFKLILENFTQENRKYLSGKAYQLFIYKEIITTHFMDLFFKIFGKIQVLLQELIVYETSDNFIAHYTTSKVAYLMLDYTKKEQVSKLRLNPIDFMNDPTEGNLIYDLLKISSLSHEYESEAYKPFIGCFTLHHDSLNQFRLYGKEQHKEASGVSLVLERDNFFSIHATFSFVNHITNNTFDKDFAIEKPSKDIVNNDLAVEQLTEELKLPLYRCIYFDPASNLIQIAHREEWTFCREAQSCEHTGWVEYQQEIKIITERIKNTFATLSSDITDLISSSKEKQREEQQKIDALLLEILLPIRYLIKHLAFKEEQECRVIYIAKWTDQRIQLDGYLQRVYMDYRNILPAMEKIFLPVGALHHESTLQYLGETSKEKKFKVKRSNNPFRQFS